jgi:hypothetical protein
MQAERINKQVREIQWSHRKGLLLYRHAVLKTPRPPQLHNLRTILTNGIRLRHIEGFLGIKPIVPITNVFEISPNDRVHVISVGSQTKRANCVVCHVKERITYIDFTEVRHVEIALAIKNIGYFAAQNSRVNVLTREFLHQHPELTFDVDEYRYKTFIVCLIDGVGNILRNSYILTKI